MSDNDIDSTGPIPFNIVLLGAVAVVTVFMIWCGISNTPLPEWVYWIATLL